VKEYTKQRLSRREREASRSSLLNRVLTSATFAEKIDAIREHNPYFYLLTDVPTKEKL
jgi:hypothetical protein